MRVLIPSALRSYTAGASEIEVSGATAREVLAELERRYPGMRFRVVDEQGALRPHIRVTVNLELADLDVGVRPQDELAIIMAFSGG